MRKIITKKYFLNLVTYYFLHKCKQKVLLNNKVTFEVLNALNKI